MKRLSGLFSGRSGIRRRLLVWGLTLLGIALIVNTLAGSLYTRRMILQEAGRLQKEVASRVAFEIEEFIRRKVDRLADLSASAALYEVGGREQRLLVLLLLKNDRAFTEAAILNADGMEVLKLSERRVYLPDELVDQSDSGKFKAAIKGDSYISPVYTSDKAEPYITITVPVKVTPHEVTGVITAEANLKFLWEVIGGIEFGRAGYAYLVDGRGNLIAHRDPSLVLKRTNLSALPQVQEFIRSPGGSDPSPGGEDQGIAGLPVLSTFASVEGLGWAVILEEPVDVALADVRRAESYALFLLGAGMVLGALIIVWVSNRITGPILDLHRSAEIIGKGNLGHRVEIKTEDEIGQLAREFNRMAGELQTSYATLEQKVAQRTAELAALYDVTATVNRSLELETVLQEVIKEVSKVFHFDATRIFLLDPQAAEVHLRASFETAPELAARARVFKLGQGVVGKVAESGQPVIFEDAQTDPRYQAWSQTKVTKQAGSSFFALFPIKAKERCVGVIVFIGKEPRRLTPEEERLLTSMADQIGVAVENATLFEETVTRAKELSALYDVAATVNQSLEAESVLREVIQKILEVTRFDGARFYLLSLDGKELQLKAHEGINPEFGSRTTGDSVGVGINGSVAATGKPAIFADIQTDPRYAELASGKLAREAGYRAYISLPLKAREKIIGVMNFLSYRAHEFLPRDIALFTSMANQIGVALENAALFEQVRTRSRQLAALSTISATVNRSLEPDVVLKESADKVCDLLGFDAAWIYVLDPSGQELHLRASKGLSDEVVQSIYRREVGRGSMGKVIASGEPLVYEDIQTDPNYLRVTGGRRAQAIGFRTLCNVPVKSKERTLGVLNVANYSARRVSPEELELIGSIANEIGVGVENARLFEETVQGAQRLSALYTVSYTVSQSLDLDRVLQEVIEKITEIFHFDTMRIYLFNERDELRVKASYPPGRDDLSKVRSFRRGEGIIGRVADQGIPMMFDDVQTDPQYRELSATKNTQGTGFRFLGAFPIKAKLKSVGAMVCNSKATRRLTPEEARLIESMAGQIGVAVENARLFYETKEKSSELEKANVELIEANRAKADFLAAMSHELRTPLNVIIGNADLIKDGTFGNIAPKQKSALDKILHYSETLLKLINDVLTLTKVEASKVGLNISTFHVDEVITHAQSYVEQLNRNGRLKIVWDIEKNLPPLTTDALKLEEILQNLIGNAFKFTLQGKIEVRVRDLNPKGRVEFSVADTGMGIPAEEIDRIFEQFHQLKEAHTGSYSGVGLGLNIVKRYLEMMRGDIKVESEPGQGSTFIFELPYSIQ
ncbi:MAG: GAF domain-containing protein [Deltaproteobacteria bacterium]|nr:GAF domain-containing protein [Deltaproteobacteria bacterium]